MPEGRHAARAFTVGPTVRQASSYIDTFRANEDGALVACEGHSRWYEQAARGQVFAVTTALTGTTLVANNCCNETTQLGPTAGVATLLTLLNPPGSDFNLEILQGQVAYINAAGQFPSFWMWCGQTPRNITATENANKRAMFVGQGVTRAKAWTQTALTGGAAHRLVRPFAFSVATTTAAIGDPNVHVDNVDGALVVPPGAAVTIAPGAANPGTTWVIGAEIQYAEVPIAL